MPGTASATGAVALDIGAGHGALIVRTGPHRLGAEIEVVRDADGMRTHVAVLARETDGRETVCAAVFGSLPAGRYHVLGCAAPCSAVVADGAITELSDS